MIDFSFVKCRVMSDPEIVLMNFFENQHWLMYDYKWSVVKATKKIMKKLRYGYLEAKKHDVDFFELIQKLLQNFFINPSDADKDDPYYYRWVRDVSLGVLDKLPKVMEYFGHYGCWDVCNKCNGKNISFFVMHDSMQFCTDCIDRSLITCKVCYDSGIDIAVDKNGHDVCMSCCIRYR
jgi:hypothetical protein